MLLQVSEEKEQSVLSTCYYCKVCVRRTPGGGSLGKEKEEKEDDEVLRKGRGKWRWWRLTDMNMLLNDKHYCICNIQIVSDVRNSGSFSSNFV
jgi:hypothetical protein